MPFSWKEIKTPALSFFKQWEDAHYEDRQAKPFLIDFFEVSGISKKRIASFEHNVKKYGNKDGYVDLFWPGFLLVKMKSRGKDLCRAYTKALDYFTDISESDLPQYELVCDFARLELHDLKNDTVINGAATDTARVAFMFERYQQLTSLLPTENAKPPRRTKNHGGA